MRRGGQQQRSSPCLLPAPPRTKASSSTTPASPTLMTALPPSPGWAVAWAAEWAVRWAAGWGLWWGGQWAAQWGPASQVMEGRQATTAGQSAAWQAREEGETETAPGSSRGSSAIPTHPPGSAGLWGAAWAGWWAPPWGAAGRATARQTGSGRCEAVAQLGHGCRLTSPATQAARGESPSPGQKGRRERPYLCGALGGGHRGQGRGDHRRSLPRPPEKQVDRQTEHAI